MGRHKNIETPEELWGYFEEYEKWCEANPVVQGDYVGQLAEYVEHKHKRPYTWFGFESFVWRIKGVISDLGHYERNLEGRYSDFVPTIKKIKDCIKDQQVSGAMTGVYNANLTARLNGLTEKTENKNDTKIDGKITFTFDLGEK